MTAPIAAPAPQRERFHALDGARAIMLLLGIPFHTAAMYSLRGGWLVDAQEPSHLASLITALVHSFRMPGFFILAGFFAAMLLARRSAGQWLTNRFKRLLVPFASSLLLLGGWEVYWMGASAGLEPAAAFAWTLEKFPGRWINHRWFLIVLFAYCTLTAAVHAAPAIGAGLRAVWRRLGPARLPLLLVALPIAAQYLTAELGTLLPRGELRVNLQRTVMFAPYFLIGVLAFADGGLSRVVFRPKLAIRIAGALLLLAYCVLTLAFRDFLAITGLPRDLTRPLAFSVTALAGVFVSALFYYFVGKVFATGRATVRYFVAASLVIYLFHEVFLLPLGVAFRLVDWPASVEMLLIVAATLAGTVLIFEVIRRFSWLSFLFNGGPASPVQPAAFLLTSRFRKAVKGGDCDQRI
ncbi:acyltransferase family protein [Aurantiacibacter suaedae]|uniref:acyltransferase family protein n=1 Tax=Aurantiacibacter suaedae TaxID=2545755 RepID=UPI001386DD20|nr:acyltransferase family protein [Aurantiacibacter suaedae]